MSKQVLPYPATGKAKKEQVAMMFDSIAHRYDFLNHFLSLGTDIAWRKKAIRELKASRPGRILDVATGTGDLAIEAAILSPEKITGIDLSAEMLKHARKKLGEKKLEHLVDLLQGDSENLPFPDNSFDAVTVAFGVRNFENPEKGLQSILRVLKPGGKSIILEFSKPAGFPVKSLYLLYFKYILPFIGKFFSGEKAAYAYLPESVTAFPEGQDFLNLLKKCGFRNTIQKRLSFGIASLYIAEK